MEVFAKTLQERQVTPEFEAYDVGHLYNLKYLERAGLVKAPYWIQFVLGVMGGLAATPKTLLTMIDTANDLFGRDNYRWSVIGVGYPNVFHMAAMAMMLGGHVRVGLEDNLFVKRRTLGTNQQLVEKTVQLAATFEREIATPDEARAMLGLKGIGEVNY